MNLTPRQLATILAIFTMNTPANAFAFHLSLAEQCAAAGDKRGSDFQLMLARACAPEHSPEAHRSGQWMLIAAKDRCRTMLRGRSASSGRPGLILVAGAVLALLAFFFWLVTQLP